MYDRLFFIGPVETAVDQHELVSINKFQLHFRLVAGEGAIEHKSVPRRAIENEFANPFPIIEFGQGIKEFGQDDLFALVIGCRSINAKGIVHPLKLHDQYRIIVANPDRI